MSANDVHIIEECAYIVWYDANPGTLANVYVHMVCDKVQSSNLEQIRNMTATELKLSHKCDSSCNTIKITELLTHRGR
jgi:hypothetical protein